MDESTNTDTVPANSMASIGSLPTTCCAETSSQSTVHWIKKDWGKAFPIYKDSQVRIVRIEIEKGWQCSLHYHEHCDNLFHVLSGILEVTEYQFDGYSRSRMLYGDSEDYIVRSKKKHRFRSYTPVVAIEIYRALPGKVVSEDDIVRIGPGNRIRTDD